MQAQSPELSAQDVNLLHQIVLRAQNQPECQQHPNKTLFNAYEAIFAENRIDTHHDRACLRLLLQLGRPGLLGDTLYDRFEHLLGQAGIVLNFEDDDGSVAKEPEQPGSSDATESDLTFSPRKPERRNSFTSVYDITADVRRIEKPRRLSLVRDPVSPQRYGAPVPRAQGQIAQELLQPLETYLRVSAPLLRYDHNGSSAIARSTFDSPKKRPKQRYPQSQLDEDEQTRQHLAHLMGVAIRKDQLTLLRQAFAHWKYGIRLSRQQSY